MSDDIEFKVGSKYKNMKGTYEVISISGDVMVIRWENGQQMSTTIDLQRRIIDRIQREKDNEEAQKKQNSPKHRNVKGAKKRGADFKGFKASDFKNNVAGTNWRSRDCLGGAVTERLSSDKFKFNSWAVYRIPAVHWADIKHRGRDNTWHQAKCFARLDETFLYYGFYIERPDDVTKENSDWNMFISWLRHEKNEIWLGEVAGKHNLEIYDLGEECFEGVIRSYREEWKIKNNEIDNEGIPSFANFLDTLPAEYWLDLHIARKVNRDEAVDKAERIADDISGLFEILMPLYEASAAHVTYQAQSR